MTTWNPQANEILLRAIESEDVSARRECVEQACRGNAELRSDALSIPALVYEHGTLWLDGEKKEEDKAPDTIKRPTKPPRVPDPREFDVKPDENARLKFKFHGQPWPDVLQWLALIGGYSLDWQ